MKTSPVSPEIIRIQTQKSKRPSLGMWAAFAVVTYNSGALAQSADLGSIISKAPPAKIESLDQVGGDKARRIADIFGTCTVSRRPMATQRALATPAGSRKRYEALARLAGSECLRNGELHMSSSGMQASIYKALVARDFTNRPAQFGPGPVDFVAEQQTDAGGGIIRSSDLALNMAGCLVRKDEPNARAAILASAGSSAEREALRNLIPQLSSCLPPGQTLQLTQAYLAGVLAEAYYREAQAANPTGVQ